MPTAVPPLFHPDKTPSNTLTISGLRTHPKVLTASYGNSSQQVMVTRSNELWQVVAESYGKSLRRLMVTRHMLPQATQKEDITIGKNRAYTFTSNGDT